MWWELVVVVSVFVRPGCGVPGDDATTLLHEERFAVGVKHPNNPQEMCQAMKQCAAAAERFLDRVKASLVVHQVVTVYSLEVL